MYNIINMLKGIWHRFAKPRPAVPGQTAPSIIPRDQHGISRSAIRPNALKVLYRLHGAGHTACLVGGCVRDLLLGRQPKDFDIATSAKPEEVRRLFRNCRLIGRRFRLAHVVFGDEIIEVATFRTHHGTDPMAQHGQSRDGMIIRDNVYGTIDDDVWRRDFSVNALYYNIADFSIIDYTGGMQDIENRTLRMIGDPEKRFLEDPVRLIRAIRFMGKLGLEIDPATEAPLSQMSHLLDQMSPARLFQEIIKIFHEGSMVSVFQLLEKYKLLERLFRQTTQRLPEPETRKLLETTFQNSDERVKEAKAVSTSFLLTALLWRPIQHTAERLQQAEDLPPRMTLEKAIKQVLDKQMQQLAITRNLQAAVRDIVLLQNDFIFRRGKRPFRCLNHPRFRAAYDLLLLRAQSGEPVGALAEWWTRFHTADHPTQQTLLQDTSQSPPRRRRKRRPARTFREKPALTPQTGDSSS